MDRQTTATEIHEDQLLNFIVNLLTGTANLTFGENAEYDPDDIFEVLVGATTDATSISTLCERSEDAPSGNDVLYHLRTKFDLESVASWGNTVLQNNVLEKLPDKAEFVVDFHLRPFYGDEDETEGHYRNEAKAGTTYFHAYATLYARVRNKRYTLAVRRVTHGDTASEVLAEFLGILDNLDMDVKAVYLDRGFYDGKCLTLLQEHNMAYIMPVIRWGTVITEELSRGWSRQVGHVLTTAFGDHEWTVNFPVMIDATYIWNEKGREVRRYGYAADATFVDTPRQARYHYGKRFGIESSYRLSEDSSVSTTSTDPARRLLFVVISLLVQNVWRYIHWKFVSTPRRGGRRLWWWWPFEEFIDMVTRAVWKALSTRRTVPTNRTPDDRFSR